PGHVVAQATWTTSTGLKAVSGRTTRLTFPMPSADVRVDVTFREASEEEREGKAGGGSGGCSLGLGGAATLASVGLAIVRRRRDRSIGA
ncbi:MAG: hypothetical protein IJR14_05025, partial [Synergistaceae bacterium]|nr:hypothetical protein [Synergistaceae bacterium]